jgi:hypothetical protein
MRSSILDLAARLFVVAHSVDGFDPFNFFKSDIFDLWHRSPEASICRVWHPYCPCHLLLRVSWRGETVRDDDGGIPLVHPIGAAGILGLDGTG